MHRKYIVTILTFLCTITLHIKLKSSEYPINLTITTHIGAGFFAELHKVVQTIIHFENRGIKQVHVDWTDEFFPYKDGAHENGWDLYFEPIPTKDAFRHTPAESITIASTADFHELHDQVCTAPWVAYKQYLPYRKFVRETLDRYIKIQQPILDTANNFYETKLRNKICIGVHARIARAHAWLVPGKILPTLESYFAQVDKLLEKHDGQDVIIFVASDSHQAIGQFKDRYGDQVAHIDAFRSAQDQDPCIMYTKGAYMKEHPDVWHKEKHKYYGGLTTLLDCLLLAKCDYLIHTTSNLAFFACYFNPELQSIYLPKGVPLKKCRYAENPNIINDFLNPE